MTSSYLFRDLSVVRHMLSFQNVPPSNDDWKTYVYRDNIYTEGIKLRDLRAIIRCTNVTIDEDWKNKHWSEIFETDPNFVYDWYFVDRDVERDGIIYIDYKSVAFCLFETDKADRNKPYSDEPSEYDDEYYS